MKIKKFFVIALMFFIGATFLVGCGGNLYTFETTFPQDLKIVVRISNGTVFFEETFIREDNIYYYKYQEYTSDFNSLGTTSNEYAGVQNSTGYTTYSRNGGDWYEISSINFGTQWSSLISYCSSLFTYRESEKQADVTINGTSCYKFVVGLTTINISKDDNHIMWRYYGQTSSAYILYEVQSLTTVNVFSGISTSGIVAN